MGAGKTGIAVTRGRRKASANRLLLPDSRRSCVTFSCSCDHGPNSATSGLRDRTRRTVTHVVIQVAGYRDSDDAERAELAADLRSELLLTDVDDVTFAEKPAPPDAKGPVYDWMQLVVTAAEALPSMWAVLQGWIGRHEGASISVTIDGDTLTLTDADSEERGRMLAFFERKHGRSD